jgi:Predicted AAA-ATPase.
MLMLSKVLSDKYIVIKTSFEGIGDDLFDTEERFSSEIFGVFADSVEFNNKELAARMRELGNNTSDFKSLSRAITGLINELGKNIVLIVDEVDKSSANRVFMQFLGLLRNKFLAMNSGEDKSFQSVILGGVHDIKNIKLMIREEKDRVFNSPWNVAADFRIDMSFSEAEIETMLLEYVKDTGVSMDTGLMAAEIRRFTSGYPYLVSRLCKNIDEYLGRDWTLKGLEESVKMTLNERSTLFDDVIKNIENNPELKALVYEILVEGREILFNPFAYEKGIMYGIFAEKDRKLHIDNRIFESLLYDYLLSQQDIRAMASRFSSAGNSYLISNGELDMEKVLLKFQEFMYEQYRHEDERFYETNGRLIFLAYMKPILNGHGFSFVEAQTRENRRMDVVITFGFQKYIVELKIWNGRKYEEKGFEQLADYLEVQKLDTGYMVIFNFNCDKKYSSDWVEINGKKIFEVIV